MRLIFILFFVSLLVIASCQNKPQATDNMQKPQGDTKVEPPEQQTQDTPKESIPVQEATDTLVNDCPYFSDLNTYYENEFRTYISVLSAYHAIFKDSKDVQGYKIRGGLGAQGQVIVYCKKGIESLSQDPNLIYCSGDNTNTPLFAESFEVQPDNSTRKIQKKITLIFKPDGSFYKTECK